MSMGIEYYINNAGYGPPWYSYLLVLFVFLVTLFGLGYAIKLVVDFFHKRKIERADEKK